MSETSISQNPVLIDGPSTMTSSLDAHDRPPESIKSVYKKYQKLTLEAIQSDPLILDFRRGLNGEQQCSVRKVDNVPQSSISAACSYLGLAEAHKCMELDLHVSVYESETISGEPLIVRTEGNPTHC